MAARFFQALRRGVVLTVAALALASPALAAGPDCAVSRKVFTARAGLERIGLDLRQRRPVKILAIGSSSTFGYGMATPAVAYPARLQATLSELTSRQNIEVENAGVSGESADQTIARLEAKVLGGDYDLVIWQVGTNDAVRGGDEVAFREQVRRGIRAVRGAGSGLILVDQQFYPAIKDPARYERYVGIVGDLARDSGVSLFSRYALMRGWGDRSADELRAMLFTDGFHMSERGYSCLASLLADDILDAASARAAVAAAQ